MVGHIIDTHPMRRKSIRLNLSNNIHLSVQRIS